MERETGNARLRQVIPLVLAMTGRGRRLRKDITMGIILLVILILAMGIGAVIGGVIGLTLGLMSSPALHAFYGVLAGGSFGFLVGLIIVVRAVRNYNA